MDIDPQTPPKIRQQEHTKPVVEESRPESKALINIDAGSTGSVSSSLSNTATRRRTVKAHKAAVDVESEDETLVHKPVVSHPPSGRHVRLFTQRLGQLVTAEGHAPAILTAQLSLQFSL